MGNQLGADRPAHHDYDLSDLGLVYDSRLGNGMFLKTIKCLHDEGAVVVKVYTKRPKENLAEHAKSLSEIRDNMQLVSTPNVFPYQKFIETEKAGYLVRQYFLNNLYDRISTRPFLSQIEKKWISFQLLFALSQIHFYGIYHGDVKCENVLVTSSNWVYLSDFAPYKPTYIPDNPAYFSFFFDSSGRRTCYLAPERFYANEKPAGEGELSYQMDIFGMGCVIAELFLEGVPIFEYHQLLSYRKGDYNPLPVISRINDPHIEALIAHMIQRDPSKRLSARNYLLNWSKTVFPEYFQFLHSHVHQLLKMSPDDRIVCVDANFDNYIKIFTKQFSEDQASTTDTPGGPTGDQTNTANDQPAPATKNDVYTLLMETEKFIRLHEVLQKGGSFVRPPSQPSATQTSSTSSYPTNPPPPTSSQPPSGDTPSPSDAPTNTQDPMPNGIEPKAKEPCFPEVLPTIRHDIKALSPYDIMDEAPTFVPPLGCEGLTILLGIVCSCMRAARLPSSKITALDLLRRFSIYLQDDCRLQRIVPYVVTMLSDSRALVRATAIRTLAYVLDLVQTFPPSDSHIFPEYILPALNHFPGEEAEEIVRVAFAGSLAQLAETAKRFLEASQFFKQSDVERKDISYQVSYDKELIGIQDMFYDLVVEIVTKDNSSVVRRTLLTDITRLALFFGRQKTNDQVLPLIITFLNDRDWLLRCAFFHNIVGVSAFVGRSSLEQFMLPCIIQALTDEEEFVVEKAVSCLACLCELGLFRKHILLEIVHKTAPLLLHPNNWVRYGSMAIMEAVCKQLGTADIHCFVHPILRPFLSYDVLDVTEQNLLLVLIPPVSRSSYDKAVDLMFDFEGRTGQSETGVTIPTVRRGSIFRVRSQPSDMSSVVSGISTTFTPSASVQSSLNSSGMFSLDSSTDGSPPKVAIANSKNHRGVFIGSQRRESVEEAPPDIQTIIFMSKLDGLGITKEEQAKLVKMRDYLGSMTRAMLSRPKKSEDEEMIARENSKHYSHSTAPVHVVLIPQPEAPTTTQQTSTSYSGQKLDAGKGVADLRYDSYAEYFAQATREPTFVHVPSLRSSAFFDARAPASIRVPRLNSPAFFEIREEGPPPIPPEQAASRSSLTPPPQIPDLGALESAPLTGEGLKDLKPKGILVAHLHEHKGPVVQVKVSADNLFFATCSHDGTVKIWDCQRLEKNVTNRSRLTYSSQGGRITSLAICENSHSIASASDMGSIHVYKIECAGKRESGVHRYSGASTVKNIEKTDPVVWVDHMDSFTQSMVVYATERGGVHSWDLRAKEEPFYLKNKPNLGLVQVCTVDPQRNWVVAATSRGFITCWDLRFGIPISTWRHPSKGRVYKLAPYVATPPYSGQPRNSWIYVSTQGRDGVSVWDLESATCKMIFRVLTHEEEPPLPPVRPVATPVMLDYGLEDLQIPTTGGPDHPYFVRGLACAPHGGYLVTAGSDKRVRYWDLHNASNSCTVSGLRPEHPKPRYACSNNLIEGVNVYEEFPDVFFNQFAAASSSDSPSSSATPIPSHPTATTLTPNTSVLATGTAAGNAAQGAQAQAQGFAQKQSKHRGPPVPSPNHTDAILDVNLIELPHAMIVSCSRDGVVKVWK